MSRIAAGLAFLIASVGAQAQVDLFGPVHDASTKNAQAGQRSAAAKASQIVSLDANAMQSMRIGDEASISTPAGDRYAIVYERSEKGYGDGTVWIGYLRDFGKNYPVFVSVYRGQVSGTLATPRGKHRLQGPVDAVVLTDIKAANEPQIESGGDDISHPSAGSTVAHDSVQMAAASYPAATAANPAQIDILVFHTDGYATAVGGSNMVGSRVGLLIATANEIYLNSGIFVHLTAVHIEPLKLNNNSAYVYPDNSAVAVCTALNDISGMASNTTCSVPSYDTNIAAWVAARRETFGADLVTLLRVNDSANPVDSACGRAWMGAFEQPSPGLPTLGQSVVNEVRPTGAAACDGGSTSAGDTALTHELGHNMGAAHDFYTANDSGLGSGILNGSPAYNRGYCNASAGTVMAYSSSPGCGPIVPYFSNPLLTTQCNGAVCGVDKDVGFIAYHGTGQPAYTSTTGADSATAINANAPYIAAYRAQQLLGITMVQNPNPFVANSAGTYTITINNTGASSTTSNLTLTDTLPAGTTLTSVTGTGWSCTGTSALVCTFAGTLASAGSTILTLNVQAGSNIIVANTATVSGGGDITCPSGSHCSASAGPAQLQVTIDATPNPLLTGGDGNYVIKVTNTGIVPTNGPVTLSDSLLSGGVFISQYTPGSYYNAVLFQWDCLNSPNFIHSNQFSCTLTQAIQPGQSVPFTFVGHASASATNGNQTVTIVGGNDPSCSSGAPPARCSATVLVPVVQGFTLSASRSGTGSGTVSSSPNGISCGTTCSAIYASGTQVTLTATPATGSLFTGWSGACSGAATTCTVTMSTAQTVTATFDLIPSYTVTPSAGTNGTITPSAPQSILSGVTTSFTVTADSGYIASIGGTCGGSLAGTIYTTNPVIADCTIIATFTAKTWVYTRSLSTGRSAHTATLLSSGKVLVVGGYDADGNSLASAELYDPSTGTWNPAGSLSAERAYHTATLLTSGKVLIAGGSNSDGEGLASTELYDPSTGAWSTTGDLNIARNSGHTATLLPSGKVLVAGGKVSLLSTTDTAELFDPSTGVWSTTGSLGALRTGHSATLLQSGKVWVLGGSTGFNGGMQIGVSNNSTTSELYDPSTGIWSSTANPSDYSSGHTATLLPSGEVLTVGMVDYYVLRDICQSLSSVNSVLKKCYVGSSSTAKLYDPTLNSLSEINSPLELRRYSHTATLVQSGDVLIVGGYDSSDGTAPLASAELFDPSAEIWSEMPGSLNTARGSHTTTLLSSGEVLVVGGVDGDGLVIDSAELYEP